MKKNSKLLSCILSFILLIPSCFAINEKDMNKIQGFYNSYNRIKETETSTREKMQNLFAWKVKILLYIIQLYKKEGSIYAGEFFQELLEIINPDLPRCENYDYFSIKMDNFSIPIPMIFGTFHYPNRPYQEQVAVRVL